MTNLDATARRLVGLALFFLGTLPALVPAGTGTVLDEDVREILERGRELVAAGEPAEALPFYEQALDMERVHSHASTPALGRLLAEHAVVLRAAGLDERAAAADARSRAIFERAGSTPSPQPVEVTAPEPAPRTVLPRAAGPRYRAQLASREDRLEARRTAIELRDRHPRLLDDLPAHVETVDLGGQGIWHRVQFGDFPERLDALRLCRDFAELEQECWVVEVE